MKYVSKFLILSCFLYLLIIVKLQKDTKDEDLVKKFNIKHIKDGDGKTFPEMGNLITLHYIGT